MRIISNLFWLTSERIAVAVVLLASSIVVIRYLGPEDYGVLALFQAILALFVATSEFGVRRILVTLKQSSWLPVVYGQALRVKVVVACGMATIYALMHYAFELPAYGLLIFLFIVASPLEVFVYYFEATLNNKPLVTIRLLAVLFSSIIRIGLCWAGSEVWLIAATLVIPPVATALLGWKAARADHFSIQRMPSQRRARIMFSSIARRGTFYWLSLLAIQVHLRADVFALSWFMGPEQVGVYSAPQKLIEQGVAFFSVLSVVGLPFISKLDRRVWLSNIKYLYAGTLLIAGLIAVPLFLMAETLIEMLYGPGYRASVDVMKLLALAFPIAVLANVSGVFYSIYRIEHFAFIRNLLAALTSIALNVGLIPVFGVIGAAMSALISNVFLCFAFELLVPSCRINAIMKLQALVAAFTPGLYIDIYSHATNKLKSTR